MIQGLKPYPAYKDSGVPWLGEVPGHWEVRRLKYLLRERESRSFDGAGKLLRVSQYTGVTERKQIDGADGPDTRATSLVRYKRVQPDDLVVNIMLAWNGSMGVSRFIGITSPAYCVYQFGAVAQPWYFHHLLRSPAYKARIRAVSSGVVESRLRLYTDDLYRLEAILPPFPDQSAIVRFLGHVDGKIQRAIRAKQTLIKLLEEEKQVLIHRAITGQIDVRTGKPYPAYKPSGVEWLGQVPEHWKVVQLRRLISFISSGSRGWARYYSDEGDIFIQSGNLGRSMELDFSFVQHVALPHGAEGLRTRISQGDVLVCVTGALTGNVALVDMGLPVPAYVNQHVALVRPKSAMAFPRYLATVLFSGVGKVQFKISEYGGTKQGLGLDDVKSVILPLPERSEQVLICDKLGVQLAPLTRAVNEAQEAISLLREYRTRLVADVVTGKLDVRDAAARLPAEPEAEVEATEPDEDLDLPQAAEDEGSYDGGQEED